MTIRPPRTRRPDVPAQPERKGPAAIIAVKRVFGAETGNYFLLLGTTLFLVIFGVIMVLSSSFVESYSESADFFTSFLRQGSFALIGIPLMLIAARMSVAFWKRWAWAAIFLSMGLQLLVFVPGIGWGTGGNQNWIRIGSFSAQPSEVVKLALVLWLAWIITAKRALLNDWKHVALPIAPVGGAAIGFVLLGNDLGTAAIMLMMVLGALFYAGVRLRIMIVAVALVGILGYAFASLSSNRSDRVTAWMNGCSTNTDFINSCWQTVHGWWALASGGIFGSGLGSSRAKWNWLPAADNDFIFAIVGDELGLIGALVLLLLFVVLAIAFVRIIRSSRDPFVKTATSVVMIWIIGQAFVNIAVVLGVLPVLGVPLPLVSAGGSALITSLLAIGVVLSFARHAPESSTQAPAPLSDESPAAAPRRMFP